MPSDYTNLGRELKFYAANFPLEKLSNSVYHPLYIVFLHKLIRLL